MKTKGRFGKGLFTSLIFINFLIGTNGYGQTVQDAADFIIDKLVNNASLSGRDIENVKFHELGDENFKHYSFSIYTERITDWESSNMDSVETFIVYVLLGVNYLDILGAQISNDQNSNNGTCFLKLYFIKGRSPEPMYWGNKNNPNLKREKPISQLIITFDRSDIPQRVMKALSYLYNKCYKYQAF